MVLMAHLLTESLHNNLRSLFGCHIWKPATFLSSHLRPPRGPVNWFVIESLVEFCMKYQPAGKTEILMELMGIMGIVLVSMEL